MKHIVCYSGGHSSALVAIEVTRKYGKEDVILLNHDINPNVEDKDIKRFKQDVSDYLGIPITYCNHSEWETKDQFDVCVDAKAFKVGNGTALCTNRLKTAPFENYLNDNFPDKNCCIYYGFDANEKARIQRRVGILSSMGYKSAYPLAHWERTIYSTKEIGVEPPLTYGSFRHANCFSSDTKFITDSGILTFGESVGKVVNVITRDGWKSATIKEFGEQQIVELTLSNSGKYTTVKTTLNHRWILPKHNHKSFGYVEKTTSELNVGDIIPTIYSVPDFEPDRIGIQHGFTFGDGSLYRTSSYMQGKFKSRAYFAEGKKEVVKYFDNEITPANYIHGLPASFKELPDINSSKEYLLGFIIGLVASDGSVDKSGINVSNKSVDVLKNVKNILAKLGIIGWLRPEVIRDTNYKSSASICNIVIPKSCFKKEWILREFHKERFGDKRTEPKSWKVDSINITNDVEKVYCVVVDDPVFKEFTLDANILTGNCTACLKAGKQHWYIVYLTRKDLWEKAKQAEDVIGYSIIKDAYLDELEPVFAKMQCKGITTTEHEKGVTFFARVKRDFPEVYQDGDEKPCECVF